MSWSISAIGKPAALKAALVKEFASRKESCKNVPHKVEAIGIAEQLVNNQLDFMAGLTNPGIAKVEASGSAYVSDTPQTETTAANRTGYSNVRVDVQQMSTFVE